MENKNINEIASAVTMYECELDKYNKQQEEIKSKIEDRSKKIEELKKIKEEIDNFYKCDSKYMEDIIDLKVPSIETIEKLKEYLYFEIDSPLHEYSKFDSIVLASIYKQIHSIYGRKSKNFFVSGYLEPEYSVTKEKDIEKYIGLFLKLNVYLTIGDEEEISNYRKYNKRVYTVIGKGEKPIRRYFANNEYLDNPDFTNVKAIITNRKEAEKGHNFYSSYNDYINIKEDEYRLDSQCIKYVDFNKKNIGKTISDDLDFKLSLKDDLLRDFIYKIALYKKNNNIIDPLTTKELVDICNIMYGEHMKEEDIERQIPKNEELKKVIKYK